MRDLTAKEAYTFAISKPGRIPEIEKFILKDQKYIYYYCFNHLKRRWLEAEPYFRDPYWAICYALDIMGNTKSAVGFLRPLVSDKFVSILNTFCADINRPRFIALQECIIQERPDLINRIYDLYPKLKEKYSYDLSLSGVEI